MMEFEPNIKPKRRFPKNNQARPFPLPKENKWKAVFTGFSVQLVESDENIRIFYENGYFGKGSHSRSFPLSMTKASTSAEHSAFGETLGLDLEESYFLAFILEILDIFDAEGRQLSSTEMYDTFVRIKSKFAFTLAAYIYLRSKAWVVKSGLKFGGDFLVYKQGMRFYHASFIVVVSIGERSPDSKYVQGMQRVAETSDKDILFLAVHAPENVPSPEYRNNLDKFSVTETIPRRFDFKKHVQNKQITK